MKNVVIQKIIQSLTLVVLIFISLEVLASDTIKHIIVEGNETTQLSVFLRQISIHEGDTNDVTKIEKSVQSIMDLGLFSNVTYALKKNGDDYDLIFSVEEKHYILVIPRLKYTDGELHKGIQLRFDNLFGLTHQLKYLYENKGSHVGTQELRQRLSYVYPWFLDSNQTLNFSFISENLVSEQLSGAFLNNIDKSFSIGSRFWLNDIGVTEGVFFDVGLGVNQRDQEDIITNIISNSVSSTAVSFGIGNKQSHIHKYNRSGKEYEYSITAAGNLTGSESTYFKHLLFYKSYYTFTSRPRDNLNVHVALGHATTDILNDSAFTLDARNDLRGYDKGRFKGNAMYILNTEYMTPSSFSPNFRYITFIDAGTTADSITNLLEEHVKYGFGFGIRWKIPSFVHLDIRIDFGYGLDDKTMLTTFGTSHVF